MTRDKLSAFLFALLFLAVVASTILLCGVLLVKTVLLVREMLV